MRGHAAQAVEFRVRGLIGNVGEAGVYEVEDQLNLLRRGDCGFI